MQVTSENWMGDILVLSESRSLNAMVFEMYSTDEVILSSNIEEQYPEPYANNRHFLPI